MSLPNPDKLQDYPLERFEIGIDADRNMLARSINLYVIGRKLGQQRISVMNPPTFTTYEDEGRSLVALRDPAFTLSFESAQRLMDELWRCGIRPTEEGTAGQVAAMQAHLQDMRKIVFDFIGKPPVVPINWKSEDAFKQMQIDEARRREKAAADDAMIEREFGHRKDQ